MVKPDNADIYKVPHDMMTISGIWPEDNPTIFYRIRTFSTWFFAIGLVVVQSIEALNDIKDFAKLSEIAYILITIVAFNVKLGIFTVRKQKFRNMINHLKDPIFVSYPDNINHYMVRNIRYTGLVASTLKYFFLSCAFFYLIFPILDNKPLPFPFPYELGKYRPLMYAFQSTAEAYAAWNNACLDTLCACMIGVAIAQLEILAEKIVHITEDEWNSENLEISETTDKATIKKLKQCIEHHLAIITYVDLVEQVFSTGLFLQFMTSAIVICSTLFHFVLIDFSVQFLLLADYFVSMTIELFIYCWYGNEVILKSTQLGEACYKSTWYLSNNEVRKNMFIIMERCKRPLKITTMRFATLSLAVFASILQWSYSCLMLLLKMYYKRTAKQVA